MIDLKKPLPDYSDIELKAIAFDESQLIKIHERNVNLILAELERRSLSRVVATMDSEQLNTQIRNI